MISETILNNVEKYVTDLFSQFSEKCYSYHNFQHTLAVVNQAKVIAEKCCFNEQEKKVLLISAWFHDIGYLFTNIEHEEKSKLIAKKFLLENSIDISDVEQVEKCIDATKFPQNPQDKLCNALCDADFYHFAREDFFDISINLWKELQDRTKNAMSEKMYWKITLELFEIHEYHTLYGKNFMKMQKEINYQKLKLLAYSEE